VELDENPGIGESANESFRKCNGFGCMMTGERQQTKQLQSVIVQLGGQTSDMNQRSIIGSSLRRQFNHFIWADFSRFVAVY
jgi:hypothetical protein